MPAMLVALYDVNADVRCAAADCLGHLGVVSRAMVQALVQSLKDPNAEVRRYAATTLGRLGQQARESTTALQIASISDIAAKVR
ncbi:HEAT repeat domain-containing protein, partial [Vibrio parahaemolyticus]|uniref:HEAT repeat domain-containing protein n=1 Tax=Vibrio parahaemolyticus TaxID=670 RepID=UPI001F5D0DB0